MTGVLLVLLYFAIAALGAFIVLQPDRFVVSRSAVIDAPPSRLYPEIAELRRWEAWAPWPTLDPLATWTYSGADTGVGAVQNWDGPKIGAGRVEITGTVQDRLVDMTLDVIRPVQNSNVVSLELIPEDGGTRTKVVWTMTGRVDLKGKAMKLVMNRDKMLGGHFEMGLEKLGRIVTGGA